MFIPPVRASPCQPVIYSLFPCGGGRGGWGFDFLKGLSGYLTLLQSHSCLQQSTISTCLQEATHYGISSYRRKLWFMVMTSLTRLFKQLLKVSEEIKPFSVTCCHLILLQSGCITCSVFSRNCAIFHEECIIGSIKEVG